MGAHLILVACSSPVMKNATELNLKLLSGASRGEDRLDLAV